MRDLVKQIQDLTNISWNERTNSSGTAGTYLKARTGQGSRALYYKLSRFNGLEIDGHECVNELIASRLMQSLGINHLHYRLIRARVAIDGQEFTTWLNSSHNFRKRGERKLSFGTFYNLYKNDNETPYEFCIRHGWQDQVHQMMLVDYLMANRDRHSSNIEVLVDNSGVTRLAPIFDTGLSLVAPYANNLDALSAFEPLKPVATTNFIGSRSLEKNLTYALSAPLAAKLSEDDRSILFKGLDDALSETHLNKIWEIIWQRWSHYENLRNTQ